jgi:C_GCAxxG_C_C family probable redox protein
MNFCVGIHSVPFFHQFALLYDGMAGINTKLLRSQSMTHEDKAIDIFKEGFNCAQSVLHAYADELHLNPDLALKIANGFGGGMGRMQEVCGAVSGGILVLGLLHGRGRQDGKDRQEETYAEVRNLIASFIKDHGTVCCRDLLGGCALLTDGGRKRFVKENLIEQCHQYVRTVCRILDASS